MAKRFRFRLDTLLRVRRLAERESKRKVAAKQAEIARIDQLSRDARQEILRQEAVLRKEQSRLKPDVSAISAGRAWIAHMQRIIFQHNQMRRARQTELDVLIGELSRARTQTRIVEKLRERRWDEYVKDRQRREQAESDELACIVRGV